MKMRLLSLLLVFVMVVMAMTGCNAGAMGTQVRSAGDALKSTMETTAAAESAGAVKPALTMEEAQKIALKHAGFTADQVMALHTEYEIEHGVPQYDVEFHHEIWEYDYEIHADTGEILSFSKDD